MPSIEYDLRYLRAGAGILEDYLLSKEVFWPLNASPPPGEPPYPQFTLGGLLLAQARLAARPLPPGQLEERDKLCAQVNETVGRWRSAWGNKAARDFHARLNLWRDFIEEYRSNSAAAAKRYTYEVARRVQLHLLATEAVNIPPQESMLLASMDKLLQPSLLPGEFIWEADLAGGFPQPTYWYLYGRLKKDL